MLIYTLQRTRTHKRNSYGKKLFGMLSFITCLKIIEIDKTAHYLNNYRIC